MVSLRFTVEVINRPQRQNGKTQGQNKYTKRFSKKQTVFNKTNVLGGCWGVYDFHYFSTTRYIAEGRESLGLSLHPR